MGAELVEAGADPAEIARAMFETNSIGKLQLLGEVLTRLEISADQKISWIRVTQAQLQKFQTTEEDTEDFVNYPRSVRGVEAAVFFRETGPDRYKISLRSQGKVDVSLLAKGWGGGGHRNAAGCERTGCFENVRAEVLSAVQKAVNALQEGAAS
jgi:phosphoesterase RecJ-like protein